MPDERTHRGPHPEDHRLFALDAVPALRAATADLSWLKTRGYASASALKLVGDRHGLSARQRRAVGRCACGDDERARRQRHQVPAGDLVGRPLWIDGFNVLTSVEAALSGGVILQARDGCYRDMASMHGSYRRVDETIPAIGVIGQVLAQYRIASCHWLLDQPVSNSGRLKTILGELAEAHGWPWRVELVRDPDVLLAAGTEIAASADSSVMDRAPRWVNLARWAIDAHVPGAWIVDLSSPGRASS